MRTLRTLLLTSATLLSLSAPAFAEVISHDTPAAPREHTLMADVAAAAPSDAQTMADLAKSYGTWGFDVSGMDTAVKPGDDFFMYANGKALAAMKIPGDQPG